MRRKYILILCCIFIQKDFYECQMRGNHPLSSLFQNAHRIAKRDFRKLTRNILQNDVSEIETLPKIFQDKTHVNKELHDTSTSTSPMSQINVNQENLLESYENRYESGNSKYALSDPSVNQNSNPQSDIEKQVVRSNAIYYDIDAYTNDVKFPGLSMPQSTNFERETGKQVTESRAIHYDTDAKDDALSDLSTPKNSNFKRDTGKQVTERNAIHYDTDVKDIPLSDLSTSENSNFKRDIEEQATASNLIRHYKGRYTKDAKSIETFKLSGHKDNRCGRIKREEKKDSSVYFDLDKTPKVEKGIKILEQEPGETQCNYNQCVEICNTIYFAVPIHLAQCYNNTCFCFPKKDLYPPVIKNFMKTHKLFGIQQTYE